MTRIGFADHLFLRMHHGIGNPVFNQFVWLFDTAISDAALENLHTNLSEGLLSRRVVRPALPTARHRWVASHTPTTLDLSTVTVPSDTLRCWAEQRVNDDLDPEAGTGWQLAAAPVAGGGTIVSLVCSHMVGDGAAMIAAVERANTGTSVGDSTKLGTPPSFLGVLASDVVDTVGQLRPIGSWLAGHARRTASSLLSRRPDENETAADRKPATASATVADAPENVGPWSPPYVVVRCSSADWNAAAERWGGTSNSMFIGVMTSVSELLGRAQPGETLRWSLPYNDRRPTDIDSNSTKIIPVTVPVSEREDRDLTRIRKASKSAFAEFSARRSAGAPGSAPPLALIQMLPDAVARRLPVPPDGAEGLCSNLGRLSDDFVTIGGARATSVAARATFHGADADFARTLGGGSTAWATETDDVVTISMHGMDPDRMLTDDQVHSAVSEVLNRWGIGHSFW